MDTWQQSLMSLILDSGVQRRTGITGAVLQLQGEMHQGGSALPSDSMELLRGHDSATELMNTALQELEREQKEKERLAAKAEWLAAKRAAREERAKKLRLMSKGAAMLED